MARKTAKKGKAQKKKKTYSRLPKGKGWKKVKAREVIGKRGEFRIFEFPQHKPLSGKRWQTYWRKK